MLHWLFTDCTLTDEGVVLEFWKCPDGEVLSTRGDLICLAQFLAAFVSASYDLMSESFHQGPCKGKKENAVSSFLSPCPPFLAPAFVLFFAKSALRLARWASQKSVNTHATAAARIYGPWCCIYFKSFCRPCNQKCLWDVNEKCFTSQHTAGSLWSACTADQRLTGNGVNQACWEHDGGPDLLAGGLA